MNKTTFALGITLLIGSATGAIAQSEDAAPAAQATQEMASDAIVAAVETVAEAPQSVPAPELTQPSCELHVFPTIEGQAQTTGFLSAVGIVGAVIEAEANADRNVSEAEYLRTALGPQFQVSAFQTIDLPAELNLDEGTEVIFETPIADRKITTKVKTRLSDSTAACYVELIVTQNLYQKKMLYGRSLNNRFIFKDFREGETEARLVKGRGGNAISHFPPKTVEERDAADADLRQAFLANFVEYATRFKD